MLTCQFRFCNLKNDKFNKTRKYLNFKVADKDNQGTKHILFEAVHLKLIRLPNTKALIY